MPYSSTAHTDERERTHRQEFPADTLFLGAGALWSTMVECQHEVGQFVSDRLTKDVDAIRKTLSCRDWTEALDVQGRWVNETLQDYSTEMKKLTGIYAKHAAATVREERQSQGHG